MTVYARPGAEGSLMTFQPRYGNYIGGEWVAPAAGRYFENASPVNGQPFCEIPRSDETDIEKALDAAHKARAAWGRTSPTTRADMTRSSRSTTTSPSRVSTADPASTTPPSIPAAPSTSSNTDHVPTSVQPTSIAAITTSPAAAAGSITA